MSQRIPSLEEVDNALSPLLDGLSYAVTHRCPVVIHTLWRPMHYIALLPFHLHLRWPGYIDTLPLTVASSIVPFLNADVHLLHIPMYSPYEANLARRRARSCRGASNTSFDGDFVHPDWEEGFARHRPHWQERLLPGCSFLSVDVVNRAASISRGTRPYLGARAVRKAPRPHVLVPAHGLLSHEAYVILADADLLIVNLQKVRGHNAITVIREVLQCRGKNQPSLIVTSSPSDLFAIKWKELGLEATNYVIGSVPPLHEVKVSIVGKDRPQAERSFEFAVTELQGYSPVVDSLTKYATAAWWSSRQNVVPGNGDDWSFRRFRNALEQVRLESPSEARLLTAAELLITKAFDNYELADERQKAVLEAVFAGPIGKRTLVLTKHSEAAKQIQAAIAEAADVTQEEVSKTGITCCDVLASAITEPYDYIIVCGYFGTATIDAILSNGASKVHLIIDPMEAGIAWHTVREMARLMHLANAFEAERVLLLFCSALYNDLLPFTDVISLNLSDVFFNPLPLSPLLSQATNLVISDGHDNVIILFVDGTWLEVPRTSRLEIIDHQGIVRLRTVLPADLQSGDEMLIVASDAHLLFSEKLMHTLDSGRLRSLAEKRSTWFTLLSTIIAGTRLNLRAVHRALLHKGIQVSYQTVLSWARPSMDGGQTTPVHWQHFKAFAEELHITVPDAYLTELFQAIRLLRTRHRLAGRSLVRAMRSAYLGRLDGTTLAQIEQEWGLDARQLVQSTRLVEVDSILL